MFRLMNLVCHSFGTSAARTWQCFEYISVRKTTSGNVRCLAVCLFEWFLWSYVARAVMRYLSAWRYLYWSFFPQGHKFGAILRCHCGMSSLNNSRCHGGMLSLYDRPVVVPLEPLSCLPMRWADSWLSQTLVAPEYLDFWSWGLHVAFIITSSSSFI